MNVEACIKERRSVRKFAEAEVTTETLNEIVDLARYAPSWKNSQVVRYHIITSPERLTDAAQNGVHNFEFNAKTISRCKALVVVSTVKEICGYENDGSFTTAQGDRWEAFDAGIATQTFCLAVHAKGLGSVILGIFDENYLASLVNLPANQRIAALVAVGYPQETGKAAPPRKEVTELASYL